MLPIINVVQEEKNITAQQGCPTLNVVQEQKEITSIQDFPKITVEQKLQNIIVIGTNDMTNILPYGFVCTVQGQTTFGPLAGIPKAIWVFITGAAQNPLNPVAPDFTIQGLNIVTSSGCNLGDTIFGMVQY